MKTLFCKTSSLLTTVIILLGFTAFSQAPQKISFQAVVRNSSNNLVTSANVSLRISLLQGTATGTVVYSETHNVATNANGLATMQIGGGTVISGVFSSINWANGPYFIKTETDPNGGANYNVVSVTQLLSVPYALYAETSGSSIPGPQGPAGPSGASGPVGATGPQGATGAQGPQGPAGPTGPQGVAGTNGTNGTNGIDGKNALVNTTTEPAGANCANGGTKVEYGLDANNNGTLDAGEINASLTKYVCNGADGKTTLVKTTTETAGANCATGGNKVEVGLDANNNGTLDVGEVDATLTKYICNGINGIDGKNALIKTSNEPAGNNCLNGGTKVECGSDLNNNGVLDPTEINSSLTTYVCNSNGSNSTFYGEGFDWKIPDGLVNQAEVINYEISPTTPAYNCCSSPPVGWYNSSYTVPAGKNLYITNINFGLGYSPAALGVKINNVLCIPSGNCNNNLTNTWIVGENMVVSFAQGGYSSSPCSGPIYANFKGILLPKSVIVIYQSTTYTVPTGYKFVVYNTCGTGTCNNLGTIPTMYY
jgi:hypothetical protein